MPIQLLIDGHSLLFRAFHALPPLTAEDGTPTGALHGFATMLLRVVETEHPERVVIVFDAPEATFRHVQYEAYKATRKESPPEFRVQVPLVRELLEALEIPVLSVSGYEADDVLGTLAWQGRARGYRTLIVTGDRDLLQLVDDQVTVLLTSRTGISDMERMTPERVRDKMGVEPKQVPDLKALMGDASDNIPGIAGIGPKSATALIARYGSLDQIFREWDKMDNPRWRKMLDGREDDVRRYRTLVTIVTNVPVSWPEMAEPYTIRVSDRLNAFLTRYDLSGVHRRLFGNAPVAVPAPGRSANPDQESAVPMVPAERAVIRADGVYTLYADESGTLWIYAPDAGWVTEWPARELPPARYEGWGIKDLYRRGIASGPDWAGFVEDGQIQAYLLNAAASAFDLPTVAAARGIPVPGSASEAALAVHTLIALQGPDVVSQRLERLYREVELPLARVLAAMEEAGIRVDTERLKAIGEELDGMIQSVQAQIYEAAGVTFNINSPQQLAEILFVKLGLSPIKRTKTGFSTDAETLEALAPLHPAVEKIVLYRQLVKLKGTYVDGLLPLVDAGGRLHTTYHQTGTATGRLSSSDPNLQNIPVRLPLGRRIRSVFMPDEGNRLLAADYSQIELRMLAHLSGDKNLLQAFIDGEDIHRRTAAEIFGIPPDRVDTVWRSRAKAVNFGIVYGISDYGLARDTGVSRAEAKDYIDRYYARYPALKAYFERVLQAAREDGWVTTILGRRRPLPDIRAGNRARRQYAERMAVNTVIQGSAADLIKIAMVTIYRRMQEAGWRSRLLLQVHDELIWDVVPSEQSSLMRVARAAMVDALPLTVPLVVEFKQGVTWEDMTPVEGDAT